MKTLMIFILLLSGALKAEVTPTTRLNQSVQFADDLNFENLDKAIERQLKSFEIAGLSGTIKFGTKSYPKSVLKESLLTLQVIAREAIACQTKTTESFCMDQFNQKMNAQFMIYIPKTTRVSRTGKGGTQFTSYYSPDLHGSRVRTERFKRAIYSKPAAPHDNYTRAEIDFKGALAGKGYEVFWVEESFFDIYLLHVQGGGRIHITNEDGTEELKYLSFAGKNSRTFQMIYRYMIQKGYLKGNEATIEGQRKFLAENPDKEEEIFGSCPSYVYFKESEEEPVGLDNIPLTEGRSLAIDSKIYPTMGIINFVRTIKASHVNEEGSVEKVPFSRFFISQDTGGAIKGSARCDLYFGYGPLAEMTAYNMNEIGEQYFLLKK